MATKFALQLNVSPAVVALLMAYQKQWDPRHSLEFIAEECLLTGITARDRSKRYSEDTQNARGFQTAIAAHPEYIQDPAKMAELARKFKIGASKGGDGGSNNLAVVARGLVAEAEAEIGSKETVSDEELERMTQPEVIAK